MTQQEGTVLPGTLDGQTGHSVFSSDGFYLGFVFDDTGLGVKCHDGTTINDVGLDPVRYLVKNIEPIRIPSNHIDNFIY